MRIMNNISSINQGAMHHGEQQRFYYDRNHHPVAMQALMNNSPEIIKDHQKKYDANLRVMHKSSPMNEGVMHLDQQQTFFYDPVHPYQDIGTVYISSQMSSPRAQYIHGRNVKFDGFIDGGYSN